MPANKTSEEDYLDSLLNSVTNNTSDDKQKKQDLEDLQSIENDLFSDMKMDIDEHEEKVIDDNVLADIGNLITSSKQKKEDSRENLLGTLDAIFRETDEDLNSSIVTETNEDSESADIDNDINTEYGHDDDIADTQPDNINLEDNNDIVTTDNTDAEELNELLNDETKSLRADAEIEKLLADDKKTDSNPDELDEDTINKKLDELKGKTHKKSGFLKRLFFKEENPKNDESSNNRLGELGLDDEIDENDLLIRQLESGELEESEADSKDKKVKKEKKPKKEKEKKEKPKKEKKPKKVIQHSREYNQKVRLSPLGMILVVSFIIIVVVSVYFGGRSYHYKSVLTSAVSDFVDQDYSSAFNSISTLKMKSSDRYFYNQLKCIMYVNRQLDSYNNNITFKRYDKALDSLVQGIIKFDKHKDEGRELGVLDDMQAVLDKINNELQNVYGLTESQARELSLIENSAEYSTRIRDVVKKSNVGVETDAKEDETK